MVKDFIILFRKERTIQVMISLIFVSSIIDFNVHVDSNVQLISSDVYFPVCRRCVTYMLINTVAENRQRPVSRPAID